jgi:hypothetical protein
VGSLQCGSQGQALRVFEKQFWRLFLRSKILFQKTLTAAPAPVCSGRKKMMTHQSSPKSPRKGRRKAAFAIASLFEGNQQVTYFDSNGEAIRPVKHKKGKPNISPNQTSLL